MAGINITGCVFNNCTRIGKDTYLNFTDSRKDWTPGNILNKIEDMFKNSISNSSNDSIYFESYRFNLIYVNGSITLPSSVPEPSPPKPNPEEQKGLSLREVVRISIGSVCLVVIAITIIIIIVVSRQNSKFRKRLSFGPFRDSLGQYRSI
ncbi:MAG: hypothetical protein EZS28_020725 [Streblomastix strix]|uniref:Uncharacterized protein n=1 Tax=Streblomastix strix TaxID=222440 RepID=A0A5J4VMZ4_9EUKA|nr:MAG: hypothetical protein EZS28_020725 [Streblomastix strix]